MFTGCLLGQGRDGIVVEDSLAKQTAAIKFNPLMRFRRGSLLSSPLPSCLFSHQSLILTLQALIFVLST
jgi:hypothetical protein